MAKNFNVKRVKGATIFTDENGNQRVKLTPSSKFKRYGRELSSGVNSRTGEKLNDCAAGYRMGYRAALGEQAAIYNHSKKRK